MARLGRGYPVKRVINRRPVGGSLYRNGTDDFGFAESSVVTAALTPSETAGLSELATISSAAIDWVMLQDAASVVVIPSEPISFTESAQIIVQGSDSANLSDDSLLSSPIAASDSITFDDSAAASPSIEKAVSEVISLLESANIRVIGTDSATFGDSSVVTSPVSGADGATFTESATITVKVAEPLALAENSAKFDPDNISYVRTHHVLPRSRLYTKYGEVRRMFKSRQNRTYRKRPEV